MSRRDDAVDDETEKHEFKIKHERKDTRAECMVRV
jgi:hypothetical protein